MQLPKRRISNKIENTILLKILSNMQIWIYDQCLYHKHGMNDFDEK